MSLPGEIDNHVDYFSSTPDDIIKYICKLCSKSCVQLLTVNSDIKKIVEPVCYQEMCGLDISEFELKRYLEKQPKLFGKFPDPKRNGRGHLYTPKYYGMTLEYYSIPCFSIFDEDEYEYVLYCTRDRCSWQDTEGYDIDMIRRRYPDDTRPNCVRFDVLSVFRMYKERKSLMRLNKMYARDMCLNLFDVFVKKSYHKCSEINILYLFASLSVYIWLLNLDIDVTGVDGFTLIEDGDEGGLDGMDEDGMDEINMELLKQIGDYNEEIVRQVVLRLGGGG